MALRAVYPTPAIRAATVRLPHPPRRQHSRACLRVRCNQTYVVVVVDYTPTLLHLLADEEEAKRKREDEVVPTTETETEAEQVEPVAKVQAVGDNIPTKAAAAADPESGNITGTPTPVLHSQPAAVVAEVA